MDPDIPEHLRKWNDTARPYPRDALLPELFEAQVRRTPEAPAVSGGGATLTYRELSGRADAFARVLRRDFDLREGAPVGLLLERSPEVMIGIWAVLKAGGSYVPLDPDLPDGRLQEMADRVEVRCLITRDRWRDRVAGREVLTVEDEPPPGPAVDTPLARATDKAYVIFTSGSTGTPKAVAVPHRGPVRLIINADYIDIRPGDVFLATTSPSFDVSCFEIFGAHLRGAHLVLPPPEALLAPAELAREIDRSGATIMWLTTGLFHQMGFDRPGMFRRLRYLIAGGDTINPECMRAVLAAEPPEHLMSGYGPSENSTFSTTHRLTELPQDARTVPIGRPIANSTCYVLREDRTPCDPGEEGELYVGGDGVALGYLGDDERTAERFMPDPFAGAAGARMYKTGDLGLWRPDGVLEFLGREDRQVQIRGYRVEPAEVEAAAVAHPDVDDAKVAVDEGEDGDRSLVLMAAPEGQVAKEDRRPFAWRLRRFLQDRLPGFMIPSRFAILERLPLGRTGKVDTRAVTADALEDGGQDAEPPRDGTERVVARLWTGLLGLDRIGRDDDFFELGGQSLQVMRVVAGLRAAFGDLEGVPDRTLVRMLLDRPVLSDFAALVDEARQGRSGGDDEPVDFRKEAELAPDLRFGAPSAELPERPRTVLLTGATGFLGAFLVRRFLDAADVRLICPVRARDADAALERIAEALRRYDLPAGGLGERVTAVAADLREPALGLGEERFAELTSRADAVLHNGAHVNFLYPYRRLAPVNVGSVRELIRLAALGDPMPVHYVSSVDVLAGLGTTGVRRAREDDPLGDPAILAQGYAETKWVAESLLRQAAARGLPVSVYRPAEITGTRDRGVQNTATMMTALFKTIAETGLAPAVPMTLDLVPVDCAAEALAHLVLREPPRGHAYHLSNPAPAPLSLLLARLRALGYAVRELPYDEWTRAMAEAARRNPDLPLAGYLPMFTERPEHTQISVFEAHLPGNMPILDRDNIARALGAAGPACPPVDAALLDLYLEYLIESGFLAPAREPRS
ncbi:amino acid adenylation domain-containing protein [Bailinhaonella thermotolerans]|uniref:Amino acid adenylation domain-containing protein n=1 Tax=Bailinhaonella thermotolerans TaxID=1070861 RepID=A0A3A4A5W7_9ACTN|nr:amino acid adenylation domain-containing protein [Bailinhaonella thermotolerans]RJL23249.1 amino acid adenylation domain-containing protein [Bailinhaonella thermotolerans]